MPVNIRIAHYVLIFFLHSYTSGDGTSVSKYGVLKPNPNGPGYVLVEEGAYTYLSPEGQTVALQYAADEHGFRASGTHIPQEE